MKDIKQGITKFENNHHIDFESPNIFRKIITYMTDIPKKKEGNSYFEQENQLGYDYYIVVVESLGSNNTPGNLTIGSFGLVGQNLSLALLSLLLLL